MGGMEKHDRDFKGVWIPKEIWLSENLSLMEKVLFVEIHSLDNERGCYASNDYFGRFFRMSGRQIRTYSGTLKDKGFITMTIRDRNQRVIRTAGRFRRVSKKEVQELQKQKTALIQKLSSR